MDLKFTGTKLIGTLFLLFLFTAGFAQERTVTGIVVDENGQTLPGVSIVLKSDPSTGTTTNMNGEYSMQVSPGDTLVYSFIGKEPVEEPVGQRNVINVRLVASEQLLEEVTVIGFGTQTKESVISSIESVDMEDLRTPSSNLTTSIAGKIPGMISFQTSGEPGRDNAQFFIRGVTTFGYKQDPLILIDGFEANPDDLARLEPDDVESFSIFKDAAATSVYGARGANGIISVKTKSGREGETIIRARLDLNVATPTETIDLLEGVEYMKMYNEAQSTRNPLLGQFYSEQKIQSTKDNVDPMIYPNVNWYDKLFKKSTMNRSVNLNVSGGGDVATYYVSAGMENESGLLKVDPRNNFNNNININRVKLRNNVIFKLTPTTKLDTRIQGRFTRYTGPYASAETIFNNIMNANPVDFPAVYEPDEERQYTDHILFGNTFADGSMKANPYANMVRGYEDRNESTIIAQATLIQDLGFITENLKFQAKAAVDSWSLYSSRRTYSPFYYDIESYNQITGDYKLYNLNPTQGRAYLGGVYPGRDATGHYYFEGRFNWNKAFGNHSISAMNVTMFEEFLITGGNSTSIFETLPERNMGNSGRLSYDYDKRYLLELSYGYNGSEKFMGTKRFGFFPALATGWLISNEPFFDSQWINNLKLKYSYGIVGNDAIARRADRFFYLSDVSRGYGGGYLFGRNLENYYGGYSINRYANPNITWEEAHKQNWGLEIGAFDDNLNIHFDVFREERNNIYLQRYSFPETSGLEAAISGNVGEVDTWGYEGQINYTYASVTGAWWLKVRANYTFARNKYVELDEPDYSDEYLKRKGQPVTQQWGLIAERLFVDQAEIENSPEQDFGSYMAGDIKYKDVNNDGVVNNNDRVPIGAPATPEIQYGFGLSGGYKDFDFSFFFQGNDNISFLINPTANEKGIAPFVRRRNALAMIGEDYWSIEDPDVYAFWPRLSTSPLVNNTQSSTWWLRDGSFMRLKTIEMGYNIGSFDLVGMESLRIYFTAQNIFRVSSFNRWDPELRSEGLGYPLNRRFNLGAHFRF